MSHFWIPCFVSVALAQASPAPNEPATHGYLGVVVPRHSADLAPSAPATVRDVRVRVGDAVVPGQLLAVLESPELDQEIARARAELWASRADSTRAAAELAQASAIFERREKASDVFTKEEMEDFATRKASAAAGLESAQARIAERTATLKVLEERRRSLTVRAPFAGQVTACLGSQGEFLAAGRPVVRIATTGDLWVRFAVPAAERDGLEVGRRIAVTLDGAAALLDGAIQHISPEVDAATGMIFTEASLVADGRLTFAAGTTVRVTLQPR